VLKTFLGENMKSAKILKECLTAIQHHNFDKAAKCMADDFHFSAAVPKAINKQEWFSIHKALGHAFPDFSFNLVVAEEGHGTVTGTFTLSGTHKGTLDLLLQGIRLAATGKVIKLPQEKFVAHFHDGKLSSLEVEAVADGGLAGILKQLGLEAAAAKPALS
jgi:SnoaL-like polyketide cyclase